MGRASSNLVMANDEVAVVVSFFLRLTTVRGGFVHWIPGYITDYTLVQRLGDECRVYPLHLGKGPLTVVNVVRSVFNFVTCTRKRTSKFPPRTGKHCLEERYAS